MAGLLDSWRQRKIDVVIVTVCFGNLVPLLSWAFLTVA
jgi:hypothetical protein